MKKTYIAPTAKVVKIDEVNIICASEDLEINVYRNGDIDGYIDNEEGVW